MSALSAAELQRRHELEGAPDPFPSLTGQNSEAAGPPSSSQQINKLDTSSEAAFPSLASGPAKVVTASHAWSTGPRVQAQTSTARGTNVQYVTLQSVDLANISAKGKIPTLQDYQKTVSSKFRVSVTSAQHRTSGQVTFTIKSDSEKDIAKARKHLIVTLSPTATLSVDAPNSTLPAIIGPGGATIKHIRDKTTARIDVPRREDPSAVVNGEQGANDDPDEEPCTTISIVAPHPLALEARAMIEEIIAAKKAKLTQRIRNIPDHILPFIRKPELLQLVTNADSVNITLDRKTNTVVISGDRGDVRVIAENINKTIESLKTSLTPLKMGLPKKQHRLLTPAVVADIMAKTRCSVTVPSPDDPSDEISVWGNITQGTNISSGLQAVIASVNSQHTQTYTFPTEVSRSAQTFLNRGYLKTLKEEHPKVSIYEPSKGQLAVGAQAPYDLVGDKEAIELVVARLSQLETSLLSSSSEIEIDHLHHHSVQVKLGKRLKQLQDSNHTFIFFPDRAEEASVIPLIYDPFHVASPEDRKQCLQAVKNELEVISKELESLKSEVITVSKEWHTAILGKDNTTLNALMGGDRTLIIRVGEDAAKLTGSQDENSVYLRGSPRDVEKAVQDILRIMEEAKNDEIDNNFMTEFEISRDYVGRIVGAGGAAINRMRDQLGVKLDFTDEVEDKERDQKKKKIASVSKATVKITGRRENVEEAKRRILSQVDRLADETSEVLKIPAQYHSSLIGANGKYVVRLEDKYSVKITFPRDGGEGENRTREALKSDEVLVKGGRKGVASAKSELLDALEFEKESNITVQFNVSTRAVPRILGRGGANINDIKDRTGAIIDVDKGPLDQTSVTLRGTKEAIAAAKVEILAIAAQVNEEVTETVAIESKYHRAIIGSGGGALRDIIARCDGPSESKQQAGLVHFPRPGESPDEIQLKGERNLVRRLKEELLKSAASLQDRVVIGAAVPAQQHKLLIGRGGQQLNDLQKRTSVQIQFPGSRAYTSVGEPENSADLESADPVDIVKVMGTKANCAIAINELMSKLRRSDGGSRSQQGPPVSKVISLPLKYQNAILQQANFIRQMKNYGVQLEHAADPLQSLSPGNAKPDARIDDESGPVTEIQWTVQSNFEHTEEEDTSWTLKAPNQTSLEKAEKRFDEALKAAQKASHIGYLRLPNRKAFPRIVGTKGSMVNRLRDETGADITVSKEDNTITIIGDEVALARAKNAIMAIVNIKDRE